MKIVVRGIKHSTGEYQNRSYDNMMIHCDCSDDGKMLCGEPVLILKVKTPNFEATINRLGIKPAELLRHELRVFYDQYGQPYDFEVIK